MPTVITTDTEPLATRSRLVGFACGRCGAVVRASLEPDACFRCRVRYAEDADAPRAVLRYDESAAARALRIEFRGEWTDEAAAQLEQRMRAAVAEDAR